MKGGWRLCYGGTQSLEHEEMTEGHDSSEYMT